MVFVAPFAVVSLRLVSAYLLFQSHLYVIYLRDSYLIKTTIPYNNYHLDRCSNLGWGDGLHVGRFIILYYNKQFF
jgi:hypothetical protein